MDGVVYPIVATLTGETAAWGTITEVRPSSSLAQPGLNSGNIADDFGGHTLLMYDAIGKWTSLPEVDFLNGFDDRSFGETVHTDPANFRWIFFKNIAGRYFLILSGKVPLPALVLMSETDFDTLMQSSMAVVDTIKFGQ